VKEPKLTIDDKNNKIGTKMTQNAKQETQMSKFVREKQSKKVMKLTCSISRLYLCL
jgi:hypothetical protein